MTIESLLSEPPDNDMTKLVPNFDVNNLSEIIRLRPKYVRSTFSLTLHKVEDYSDTEIKSLNKKCTRMMEGRSASNSRERQEMAKSPSSRDIDVRK